MKRDMKLIHLILDYMERKNDGDQSIPLPSFDDYTSSQVDYHVALCVQAGFLNKRKLTLTWTGHDKLEKCREAL